MIKKRLKGLLALAVAGAVTASAFPSTASATVTSMSWQITSSGVMTDGSGELNTFINLLDDTHKSDKSEWALYTYNQNSDSSEIICCPGSELIDKLNALNDATAEYTILSAFNGYDTTYSFVDSGADKKAISSALNISYINHDQISIYEFPFNVKDFVESKNAIDPLHEYAGWQLWAGKRSGFNNMDSVTGEKTDDELTSAEVEKSVEDYSSAYFGLQIIVKDKEFTIPYYTAFNNPDDAFITVSDSNRGTLKGASYFLAYLNDDDSLDEWKYVSSTDDILDFITERYNNNKDFDVSKARLVNNTKFYVYDSNGNLMGNEYRGEYQYGSPTLTMDFLDQNMTSDKVWVVSGDGISDTFWTNGDQLDKAVSDFLDANPTVTEVTLRLAPTVYVTSESLKSGDVIYDAPDGGKEYNISTLPVNVSELSSVLTLENRKEFDLDGWNLFECISSGGVKELQEIPHGADELTFDSITNMSYNSIYLVAVIPQVDIPDDVIPQVELTVSAPELGKKPDMTAEAPANAEYIVKSVSWSTSEAFAAGEKYTVTAVLEPKEFYKFDGNTTAKVNNGAAFAKLSTDGALTVSYTFDELNDDPWFGIDDILSKENPVVKVPDEQPVPSEIIKKIKDSGKEVELDYGDYSWIIKPDFIPGFVPKPIDFRIEKVDQKNWATVVNNVTGHKYKMEIDIKYSGEFGFTAYLVIDLSEGMKNAPAGDYYANLYQVLGDKLEWSDYSVLKEENGKWTAKLKFTHASEWLITIDNEINPGSKDDSAGNGGATVKPSEIKLAKTMKSEGWSNITNEIKNAQTGSTINVTLNDETTMPEDALMAAIDKQVKLVMDAGFGREWTIDGAKAVPGKYIDLTISGVNVDIPEEAYKDILCSDSRQLKLNARMLNFTAQLRAFIGNDNIGQNAAVYLYNEETGKLVFQTISTVDKNGDLIFEVKTGGRYFIALGSEVTAPYYLCGDVNGDGVVNAIDASAILKNAVYGYPLDKRCGDTNADGVVNANDALPILHYVVGDIKSLPTQVADAT